MAVAGDHEVIEDRHAEDVSRSRELSRNREVVVAWCDVAAATVVREDDSRGIAENRDAEDISRLDG